MSKNKSKIIIWSLFVVAIFVVLFLLWGKISTPAAQGKYDAFTKCLTDKGVVMYGAAWCPHCQNEKNAFGDSFRLVNYVECPAKPQRCIAAGINGYPTWIFADGKRLEGEQGLQKLSEQSGCALP